MGNRLERREEVPMTRGRKRSVPLADNPLSRFLCRWLEEHELSREKASRRWGISPGTLRNMEAGIDLNTGRPYKPKVATLRQLAAGMGVPLATLLKLQGETDNIKVPAVPPEPLLAAMDKLLENRVLEVFTNHVALSRDLVSRMADSFQDLEEILGQLLRQSRKHGLSPADRRVMRSQIEALARQRLQYLVPLQGLIASVGVLLESQKGPVEEEAGRLGEQLRRLAPLPLEKPYPIPEEEPERGVIMEFPGRWHETALNGPSAAGSSEMTEDGFRQTIPVDLDEVKKKVDGAVWVRGDSMVQAEIHDGDYVFYRKMEDINQRDLVVVHVPQRGMLVKRFDFIDGRPMLLSENPDQERYPPISFVEDTCIHGKVVAVKRKEEVDRWRKRYERDKREAEE